MALEARLLKEINYNEGIQNGKSAIQLNNGEGTENRDISANGDNITLPITIDVNIYNESQESEIGRIADNGRAERSFELYEPAIDGKGKSSDRQTAEGTRSEVINLLFIINYRDLAVIIQEFWSEQRKQYGWDQKWEWNDRTYS